MAPSPAPSMAGDALDQLCITTLRTLAIDAVEQAQSGHPGAPMENAPFGYLLYTRYLRHNPHNPHWPNRDRFVLSAGHGCMLLYGLLHLTGYDLPLDDIKRFRQWGSKTPGHPEYGHTPGVETTTGPLGQGIATAVGMALAETKLAAYFNRPGHPLVDYYTYVLCSDGDLMEGVASEACSLAGTLKLGKLIVFYADNRITIDGSTDLAFREQVATRFLAYDWHVQSIEGNDLKQIAQALDAAQAETTRPSLIVARTHLGYGSPNKQDTAKAHGEPLGAEETKLTKQVYGWPYEAPFTIPDEALEVYRRCVSRGQRLEAEWQSRLAAYETAFPELAATWHAFQSQALPDGWDTDLPTFTEAMATRQASGAAINALAERLPFLVGGSADLTPSNNTAIKGATAYSAADRAGRNLHFGVREHAMGAILNGLALTRGFIPYGGTFLIFSDYMKAAIRLAALMRLRVIYVFTHDSIGLGEDGPTHQAVEQLAGLRAIPNLTVIRPADANEVTEAWRAAIHNTTGPTAIILTRQKVPTFDRASHAPASELAYGAYIFSKEQASSPDLILIGSGSELQWAVAAQAQLQAEGVAVRVVSMPSWELFEQQPADYRDSVLPPAVKQRIAIEAAAPLGWRTYITDEGAIIAMKGFGASAPFTVLMREFGFTTEHVVATARALLGRTHDHLPATG
ncbi:transketolase [Chloracidobacterium validum]|uniref:Transketolase n=1 Tax=Chloracidobacterium validum TaxID=2821543 RepID=A0ABX8BFJ1_9BACT|nr:transketolase [Chloracidobacterium validum]QUW03840.1 transketolase [Chloracidobacterium validum]